MQVIETVAEARRARAEFDGRIALVPTMGALHAGHVALIAEAKRRAGGGGRVAVSVFVNPTQFNDKTDFEKYPRPIEADLRACREAGADLVFMPPAGEMYPPSAAEVSVDVPALTGVLEGRHRPGHFGGVCRVVLKLLNVLTPDVAVFGLKDYQQLLVVRALVRGLDVGTEIVGCPTVREADGLALSSRNARLAPDERRRALALPAALRAAEAEHAAGVTQANRLVATMRRVVLDRGDLGHVPVSLDYAAAADAATLADVQVIDRPTVLLLAARVGATRLIDNVVIAEGRGDWNPHA